MSSELLASAQAAEDRALESWANLLLLHGAVETGDFARARAVSGRLAGAGGGATATHAQLGRTDVRRSVDVAEGNLVGGEDMARNALAIGELAGQPDALRIFGEFRALARLYQGRGDAQLIELSRQATSMFPRMAVWPASTAQYEAYFGSQK